MNLVWNAFFNLKILKGVEIASNDIAQKVVLHQDDTPKVRRSSLATMNAPRWVVPWLFAAWVNQPGPEISGTWEWIDPTLKSLNQGCRGVSNITAYGPCGLPGLRHWGCHVVEHDRYDRKELQNILRIRSVFWCRTQSFAVFRVQALYTGFGAQDLGFTVRCRGNTKTMALRRYLSMSKDTVWTRSMFPGKPYSLDEILAGKGYNML